MWQEMRTLSSGGRGHAADKFKGTHYNPYAWLVRGISGQQLNSQEY
jgi:hypothetical protein